ncbi:hypothetical protein Bealeia1_01423 [Candidatus Bealeia paramacronuclearis]|uniref:Uncharacterized protein n=1 Tax=Candidatus Bealeia paramacronuclearis TaxID=1921001 RepID=A0ABZ2C4B0_9PROT|nr:hypothetical protein [Candidatus Bealeia paramacronuclearis]
MDFFDKLKNFWKRRSKKFKFSLVFASLFSILYTGWIQPQKELFWKAESTVVKLREDAAWTLFFCQSMENTDNANVKKAVWSEVLKTQDSRKEKLDEVGVIINELNQIGITATNIASNELSKFIEWNYSDYAYIIVNQNCPNHFDKSMKSLRDWQQEISSYFPLGTFDFIWFYTLPIWEKINLFTT